MLMGMAESSLDKRLRLVPRMRALGMFFAFAAAFTGFGIYFLALASKSGAVAPAAPGKATISGALAAGHFEPVVLVIPFVAFTAGSIVLFTSVWLTELEGRLRGRCESAEAGR
jgi:hypothetical protein